MTFELRQMLLPLALILWVGLVGLFLAGCGDAEDRNPTTGYTGTEERMPTQFEGGAPGDLPTESMEAEYPEGD